MTARLLEVCPWCAKGLLQPGAAGGKPSCGVCGFTLTWKAKPRKTKKQTRKPKIPPG